MKFINVLKQYNKALIRENAKLQRTYNELISESADGEDLQNETTEEFTDPTPNPLDETEEKTDDNNEPSSSDDIRSKIIKAAKVDTSDVKSVVKMKPVDNKKSGIWELLDCFVVELNDGDKICVIKDGNDKFSADGLPDKADHKMSPKMFDSWVKMYKMNPKGDELNESTNELTDPTPNPLDEFEMLDDDPDSLDEGYGRRRNIIDNDWSYANILRDNYDSIKNLTTKEDILNRVKQLFDENNVHTPKSYEMIVKLQRSPSLYNSINYVTNTILKSMGHGVIGEDDESDADQQVDTIEQNNDVASSDQPEDVDKTSEPTDGETPPEENAEHASGEGESATIDDDGMQSLDEFFNDTDVPIDEDVSTLADEMMAEACAKKRKDLDEVELVPFKDFLKGTDDTTNADMNEMSNSDLDNMVAEGIANKDNVEDPDKIDEDELICASEFFKEVDTSSVTNSEKIDEEEITSMSDTLDLDNKLTEGDDDVMSADEFLNAPEAK